MALFVISRPPSGYSASRRSSAGRVADRLGELALAADLAQQPLQNLPHTITSTVAVGEAEASWLKCFRVLSSIIKSRF
jgi:hypothetical protein